MTQLQASFAQLLASRVEDATTSFVLLECGNAAARRPYRTAITRLRQQMEQRNRVITPSIDDWRAAWIAYDGQACGDAGIVDHFSFVVMRRLGISNAFTNDRHFRTAGFQTLF